MFLNNKHRVYSAIFYFLCFAVNFGWHGYHGLLLSQLKPVFFLNKPDLTVNILLLTNLHHAVIQERVLQVLLDSFYFLITLALTVSCVAGYRMQYGLAVLTAIFNLVYAILLSILSPLSIEGFTGWIFLPLLFVFRSETSFYYALHTMRYFFLLLFSSAALWKIRAGGIFNSDQMSAILLKQHAAYLVGSPDNWFAKMVNYLVVHTQLSFFIYILAFLSEFGFIIGFFTKHFDKILIILYLLFVVFDYFLMQINYFSWTAFLGCLWFSGYELNTAATIKKMK